jgi:16S rRNA (adenine1518-N6/adenine1519-N6)-dimethyltransferase
MISSDVEKLQQHVMIDAALLKRIVDYADIKENEIILEIGAGPGNLTELLAQKAKEVFAFEIDIRFKTQLAKLEKKHKNLQIVFEDALKATFPSKFDKIVANIPYNISEPLLMKLIDCNCSFKLAVLTVGESFASLLTKRNNNSRLSIIAPAYFDVEVKEIVPKDAFEPQPNTKSAVIVLKPKAKEELNSELFIIRELWQQRTKKTINAMREAIINLYTLQNKKRMTKNQAREVLEKLDIKDKTKEKTVETLSGKEFADLLKLLTLNVG